MNKFAHLNTTQIHRIWMRLYERVQRDCWGADWRTLRITNPGLYRSLNEVINEYNRRRA